MTLIERLRQVVGETTRYYVNPDGPEAAKEIERLREALKEIEWQLKNELYNAAYDTALYTLWPALQQKDTE